jgi:hypothetical protein
MRLPGLLRFLLPCLKRLRRRKFSALSLLLPTAKANRASFHEAIPTWLGCLVPANPSPTSTRGWLAQFLSCAYSVLTLVEAAVVVTSGTYSARESVHFRPRSPPLHEKRITHGLHRMVASKVVHARYSTAFADCDTLMYIVSRTGRRLDKPFAKASSSDAWVYTCSVALEPRLQRRLHYMHHAL